MACELCWGLEVAHARVTGILITWLWNLGVDGLYKLVEVSLNRPHTDCAGKYSYMQLAWLWRFYNLVLMIKGSLKLLLDGWGEHWKCCLFDGYNKDRNLLWATSSNTYSAGGYRMVALVPALSSLRRGPGTKTNCMATTVKTGSSSEDEIVALTGLLF